MRRVLLLSATAMLSLTACGGAETPTSGPESGGAPSSAETSTVDSPTESPANESDEASAESGSVADFETVAHGQFNEGWALEFLPDGKHLLITERVGALKLRDQETGELRDVSGVPTVHHAGQAGMHDIVVGPTFEEDGQVFLSWVSAEEGNPRGLVATAKLDVANASLSDLQTIWKQDEAEGNGHFSLRMLIMDEHLYLTSGERQKFDPAQDYGTNLGKVLRLNLDGTPATENPFDVEGVEATFFTIGHRNALGIDADSKGQVWVSEMGPKGGDELNLLVGGENYGWPAASMGDHYDGTPIPNHEDGDEFTAPKAYWNPSISPGSLEIYSGDLFTGWKDSALLGGLSGQTLVRVELNGDKAEIADDWDMGARIRAVEEAPDGSIWILEDEAGGRLLELRPR